MRPNTVAKLPIFIIGADLGQVHDYTALVVIEVWERPRTSPFGDAGGEVAWHYDVIRIVRPPLGTPYTDLPRLLETLVRAAQTRWADLAFAALGHGVDLRQAPLELVVDRTGVGVAVSDLLWEAGLGHTSITITSGDQVIKPESHHFRVPKRDLCGRVQTTLQQRRLRVADELPEARVLRAELANFKARISLQGHDSYGAGEEWREGNNDDTVLATAVAVWYGEYLAARGHYASYEEIVRAFSDSPGIGIG